MHFRCYSYDGDIEFIRKATCLKQTGCGEWSSKSIRLKAVSDYINVYDPKTEILSQVGEENLDGNHGFIISKEEFEDLINVIASLEKPTFDDWNKTLLCPRLVMLIEKHKETLKKQQEDKEAQKKAREEAKRAAEEERLNKINKYLEDLDKSMSCELETIKQLNVNPFPILIYEGRNKKRTAFVYLAKDGVKPDRTKSLLMSIKTGLTELQNDNGVWIIDASYNWEFIKGATFVTISNISGIKGVNHDKLAED